MMNSEAYENAQYDLVIAGGRIIDPSQDLDRRADLGIRAGRIACVSQSIDRSEAREFHDASGAIVVPGLIDMHTHVFWGASILSLEADEYAAATGTTTWLDAGTSGAANFPAFHRYVVEQSVARIIPFLNVSGPGIPMGTGAHSRMSDLDADLALEVIGRYPGAVHGIKVLCSGPQMGGSGLSPLRVARELADAAGLPLMCHIGAPPPGFGAVEPFLRAGDVVTHAFKGKAGCLAVAGNTIREEAWTAKRRGVHFDVGHGKSSFSYDVARAALEQGFMPDSISTDLHAGCVDGPAYSMPSVMSKFLHLGVELPEVVRLSTSRPAEMLGMQDEIGTFRVGACADVAVIAIEDGEFPLPDCEGKIETLERRLVCRLAIRGGRVLDTVRRGGGTVGDADRVDTDEGGR